MNVKLELLQFDEHETGRTIYGYRIITLDSGEVSVNGVELTKELARQSGERQLKALAYLAGIDHLPQAQVRQ